MSKRTVLGMAFLAVCVMTGWAQAVTDEVCHVGVQLHLQATAQPDESYLRHLDAFVERDMADYVLLSIPKWPKEVIDDVVRYLTNHKVHFFIYEPYPASPERRYNADDYKRFRSIAGDLFLGVHAGEFDSSGLPPETYLSATAMTTPPSRRVVKEALLNHVRGIVDDYYHASGVVFGHSSATLSHSLFAEAGVDILCSEIGENIPNVSMMIASNRGAARAYDRPWMIDHSTWWNPKGSAGNQVSPREGHTPWCFFTSLLLAAVGGADYVQLEVDWAAYGQTNLTTGKGDLPPLLPWGRALKTLYAVTRQAGATGETATPFGILMGPESGWPGVGWHVGDVRATGLFDGIRGKFMQTRDADLSLKVLDVFYPGFERCAWDPEYPGFLSESPLGQCDLVPDNLTADKYTRYRVLVALGYHRMTESLREALRCYVEQGGILICGDNLFLDEAEKPLNGAFAEPLTGCVPDVKTNSLITLSQPSGAMVEIPGYATALKRHQEWQDQWLHPVRLTSGRAVARFNDAPYLIENTIGKGRVYFVTALNMVGCSSDKRGAEPFLYSNTLYSFLHTLADHVGDGIALSPWNSLERVYTERANGTGLLLVVNHGDMVARRDATMRNPRGYTSARAIAEGTWEAWYVGDRVHFAKAGEMLAWSFDIAPKSFILYEFSK